MTGFGDSQDILCEIINTLSMVLPLCKNVSKGSMHFRFIIINACTIFLFSYFSKDSKTCLMKFQSRLTILMNISFIIGELTTKEVFFLRIIHLLYRVTCPAVRMAFDNEIQPNQLQKWLNGNKSQMIKRYRTNERVINDFQWDLLYKKFQGTR